MTKFSDISASKEAENALNNMQEDLSNEDLP
jgi:hypothetical protein